MIELQPLEFAVCLFLTAVVFGFLAYWYMRFFRVLPLDRSLNKTRYEAVDLKEFTLEVMGMGLGGLSNQTLNELGQRTVYSLHKRLPDLQFFWIARREGDVGSLVARRGGGGATPSSGIMRFDSAAFQKALKGSAVFDLTNGAADESPFLRYLSQQGLSRVRMESWGRSTGSGGILVVADADPEGQGLERAMPFFEIVKPLAAALAQIIDDVLKISRSKERAEGGLSATIEDLNVTHSRLIQKSREVKALHDVASSLSSRGAQSESTLSAIVTIVAKALEADLVAFLILDDTTAELVTQPGSIGLEGEEMFYRIPLSESRSSSVRVFKSGEPYVSGDAQKDSSVMPHYARLWNVHSLMVIPLRVDGRPIGVMRVGHFQKDFFTKDHLEMVTVIAEEAAVIVETAMLYRRLSETAEQLASMNRIKDDFVSTVSHEFKTPLTTIMGFITVILEGETGKLTEQQAKFLGLARGSAKRLAGLVSDLLDISRLEGSMKMELRKQSLKAILLSSIESHMMQATDGKLTLTHEIPDDLPMVECDSRLVELAADNLISNALKFSRSGGKVHVTARNKGEFVMAGVSDNGIGIPAEDIDRIFEKFYRASNRGEVNAPGTGLGLAIAREVITRHGGKIWCESSSDGTKFFFLLRVAERLRLAPDEKLPEERAEDN